MHILIDHTERFQKTRCAWSNRLCRYSNTANALAGRGPHWQIDGEIYGILNYDGNNPEVLQTQAKYYNWHDEIYKIGESNNFGASFSGGGEKDPITFLPA